MSLESNESDRKAQGLRRDAENRLKSGSTPRNSGIPLDREALTLLYEMASDPERSSDALRLLQELQVHQVELDLQRDELEHNEREMTREISLYKAVFELTPTVCLVVSTEGRIIEANPAAASLVRTRRGDLLGRTLHEFLKQESLTPWNDLLRKLNAGEMVVSGDVHVVSGNNESVKLGISGSSLPEGNVLLLGVVSRKAVLHDLSKSQRTQ